MNCTKCGNAIPEGSAFCLTCGTPAPQPAAPAQGYDAYGNPVPPAYGNPAAAPVYGNPTAPAQGYDAYGNPVAAPIYGNPAAPAYDAYGNPIAYAPAPAAPGPFANFIPAVKGFLSKDLVKNVAASLKSKGLEWIIFGGASVLMFALALIANLGCMIGQIIPGYNAMPAQVKSQASGLIPFGMIFILFFLLGTIVYGLVTLGVFLLGGKLCAEKPTFIGALNLVGVVTLPLTAIYTLNLIIGLISVWVCLALSIVGFFLVLILLYAALQENAAPDKSVFLGYAIVTASVVIISILLGFFFTKMSFESATSSLTSSVMGSMF